MQKNIVSVERFVQGVRTGKGPAKSSPKLLHASNFADLTKTPPDKTNFWPRRAAFPKRTFGNDAYGDCTRAKQAYGALRMERIETTKTTNITDEEVVRVYLDMTQRLYGGGDTGAYEMDALDNWRNPLTTFKDTKGHPLTIDAYTKINQANIVELKNSLALAGAHGISVCFNLPFNWSEVPGGPWDIPADQQPIGPWLPGSWGGHSMWAIDYDAKWLYVDSTWAMGVQQVSWRAVSLYMDEAYLVIDSLDSWKKKAGKAIDIDAIKKEVNRVSSVKIK